MIEFIADRWTSSRKRAVAEGGLDDVLAVVERAVEREGVEVRRVERRHLPTLHVGDPTLGEQHDAVERRPAEAALHGGRAGVAAGGDEDRGSPAPFGEDVVEQPADELEGDVLEGDGRAVEQLEQPPAVVEPDERAHLGVVERGVGLVDDALERRRGRSLPSTKGHMTAAATSA